MQSEPNNQRPRLLMVATVPVTLRGFLLPFARHFRARGWRVDGMAAGVSSNRDCVENFDRVWDVEWSRNPLHPRNLFGVPPIIREIVRREDYDLVHVHTPVAAFVTRWALRRMRRNGRPQVIHTYHGFIFYKGGPAVPNLLFRTLEKAAGRWADDLVVINREDEAAALEYRLIPPDRLTYMPGIGVDTDRLTPETVSQEQIAAARRSIGLSPTDSLFLMVAEFNPGKRHKEAVTAFARLGDGPHHLAFAGVGRMEPEIRALVAEKGLATRVHFLGFRDDIPALMRASVATLLPSEREGLPRSVMESLCLEVPVIGSDIRGIRDLLQEGGGRMTPVGDVAALTDAMGWILHHPEEAAASARRGRQWMTRFDLRRVVAMHEELYDRALARLPERLVERGTALNEVTTDGNT
ncbi:MAG TPA: glycosyltransferase [Armatimonadota bacterium]